MAAVAAQLPDTPSSTLRGHQGPVRAVRFNNNGNYCLSCGSDKIIKLWNPHSALSIKTYKGHGQEVLDIAATLDNSRLASGGTDKMIILWDVGTGQIIRKFRGHSGAINSIAFNDECTVIVTGSYDATIRTWDTRSRRYDPIQVLDEASDSISSVKVSNHEIISGCIDGKVRLYDLRAGKMNEDYIGPPVTSVSYSKDGQCILTSCLDNTLRLLDKDSGQLLNEFTGHKNSDYKIDSCFTHTDAHVVSGSEDGYIFIWDLVEGSVVTKLNANLSKRDIIYSLAFHPREPYLLTASAFGDIIFWKKSDNEGCTEDGS
ncbi:uncharacterized protein TRIADDRAFT_21018 [Trichoplax adhaerens]|uniref:WD repeat domain-containing protein 83 n=1 Tax=Trichoplax adhaerens TaxID=10228 RepID=B3RNL6_TRIAD|nr:hypothetical protein TRIADDRAFT_21018 [Trichoplax adhaerens]EDV28040.1 hypothetical protein TRIADDRAFT_21018 [Trichoplax adhaerens]|eukprot:XP_002109874.1 hypothetical protein TRIADDRAFT_21018 [Trichoplax adhaerens]